MTEWEAATDTEAAMRDALRAGDQELYFRMLARTELLLPVSADALAGRAPMGWGTWTTGGRTHVLAFTSATSLQTCLAESAGSFRRLAYPELAGGWPNPEWWLAVNPGLPIEGYLPAWFVSQLGRGDVRLPGRTRARLEQVERVARARATASVPRRTPGGGPTVADRPVGPANPFPEPPQSTQPLRASEPQRPFRPAEVPHARPAPRRPFRPAEVPPSPPPSEAPPQSFGPAESLYAPPPSEAPSQSFGPPAVPRSFRRPDPAPTLVDPASTAATQQPTTVPVIAPRTDSGDWSSPQSPAEPTVGWMTPVRRPHPTEPAGAGDGVPTPPPPTPTPFESSPAVTFAGSAEQVGEPTAAPERSPDLSLFTPVSRRPVEDVDPARSAQARPDSGAEQPDQAWPASGAEQLTQAWSVGGVEQAVPEWSTARSEQLTQAWSIGETEQATQPWSAADPPAVPPSPMAEPSPAPAASPVAGPVAGPSLVPAANGTVLPASETGHPAAAGPDPADPPSGGATAPEAPSARRLPVDFVPANDVERSLLDAAGGGSTDTFLSTLLLAKVLLPVAYTSADGSRPGDDGFEWRTETLDGESYVVVFTSPERLVDHLPTPTQTVEVKFVQLIRRWPDEAWSFAVNPGTPVGAKLPGSEIVALANWAAEVGLGDDPEAAESTATAPAEEETPRSTYAPAREDPGRPTMMQKAIAPSQLAYYLDRGYDRVSGFVHRANEVAHLRTPTKLYAALGLGYPNSPFSRDADEVYVLRWPAHRPSLYRIPYGGQNEAAMRAMEGWVIERPPFRGNGFAPGESSDVVAEFKVDSVRLPHGAELWRVGADGTERLVATLDCDQPRWRRAGED
ncbi:SseB family protein [Plantactinospora sp. B5E13]|uniref:SseB family protein n=1 Tax=unclassified Plantactinospora TaxID=2631981 RepID=UPI00325CE65B